MSLVVDKELYPCRGICSTTLSDVCIGCGRDVDQIREWPSYSDEFKREVIRGINDNHRANKAPRV